MCNPRREKNGRDIRIQSFPVWEKLSVDRRWEVYVARAGKFRKGDIAYESVIQQDSAELELPGRPDHSNLCSCQTMIVAVPKAIVVNYPYRV